MQSLTFNGEITADGAQIDGILIKADDLAHPRNAHALSAFEGDLMRHLYIDRLTLVHTPNRPSFSVGSMYASRQKFMRFSVDHFVKGRGVCLGDIVLDILDADAQSALTEGDLDDIALLDGVGCLDLSAVDADMLAIAGIVCHGAALDDSGYLQKLINSHKWGNFLSVEQKAAEQADRHVLPRSR